MTVTSYPHLSSDTLREADDRLNPPVAPFDPGADAIFPLPTENDLWELNSNPDSLSPSIAEPAQNFDALLDSSETMRELRSLFDWNPPPLKLAPADMGGSFSTKTRLPSFYDQHIAEDRICKHLVHIKHLHRKIAHVVDEKLVSLVNQGIVLPQPTLLNGFEGKVGRDLAVDRAVKEIKDEKGIQEFYKETTARFCGYVASTLTLHPHRWSTALHWSVSTVNRTEAICDGSLQIINFPRPKRTTDGGIKSFAEDLLDVTTWKKLMAVKRDSQDLASWEMKSLTVGNGDAMLAVMGMIADKSMVDDNDEHVFHWKRCTGVPACVDKNKDHTTKCDPVGPDDDITLSLVKAPWSDPSISAEEPFQQSQAPETFEDILDRSLRRGGSSLQTFREFDQHLMEEAKKRYVDEAYESNAYEGNESQVIWESDIEDAPQRIPEWMQDALKDGMVFHEWNPNESQELQDPYNPPVVGKDRHGRSILTAASFIQQVRR
jgi:hypothetical protein